MRHTCLWGVHHATHLSVRCALCDTPVCEVCIVHHTCPCEVRIGRCQSSATSIFQPPPSRRTDIVAARSAVGRSLSPVQWPGMRCLRPPRPVAPCRLVPEDAKDASVSECTWTLSALEALRNALYKFKTYLLTYLLTHLFV